MIKDVYEEILNHFSTTNEPLTITRTYDLKEESNYNLMDDDSKAASNAVVDLSLSYDIKAKHYAKVVDGDELKNYVDITWEFWK